MSETEWRIDISHKPASDALTDMCTWMPVIQTTVRDYAYALWRWLEPNPRVCLKLVVTVPGTTPLLYAEKHGLLYLTELALLTK